MSDAEPNWDSYFKAVASRPAHATAEQAMHVLDATVEGPGEGKSSSAKAGRGLVLDLGAGSGRDSLHFLARGFRVRAIDSSAAALSELKARAAEAGFAPRLICETKKLEELDLEREHYDVINASMSLPFCAPSRFHDVWESLRRALKPGGVFAAHFFGKNDTWHTGEMTFLWQTELESILIGLEVLKLTEHEFDRDTPIGEHRHWHYFEVVARKPR